MRALTPTDPPRLPRPQPKSVSVAIVLAALAAASPVAFAQTQFSVLHNFNGGDGFGPMAGVIQGPDGALYGTTTTGGGGLGMGMGTVFRFDRATLALTSIHTFGELAADGYSLYSGVSLGRDGMLYGTTYSGGTSGLGTIYRLGPDGQNFASLHSFNGIDGANPDDLGLLQAADGAFYGATSQGGPDGGGTLFRFDVATAGLTTVHSFVPPAAAGVDAGLVAGRDGFWYGTTYAGGTAAAGSVFRLDPATHSLTTLHDFSGTDGMYPLPGALLQASDGNLYGTTQLGGGYGTVYRLNPSTLAFATLHTFAGGVLEGRMPLGGLTEGTDGYLYGTTVLGGQGYGTVFRLHPATLAYNIVVQFGNANGRSPSGSLLRATDGNLYGVTRLGGSFNAGTIYRVGFADTTPPTINSITASPSVLTRDTRKLVPITLNVTAADNVDPAPQSRIIGVTSNQSITGDWVITGDLTLKLRAEHTGRNARIYTIAIQCSDAAGNVTLGSVNVTVPK